MAYVHGISVREVATALTPMTTTAQPPIVIGTALKGPVNKPTLIQNLSDFVETFGLSMDFDTYTLEEAAYVFFNLYNVRPIVCVNVLDLTRHKKAGTKTLSGTSNPLTITAPIILSSVVITSGSKTLTLDTDYSLAQEGLTLTITILRQTNITNDTIAVAYDEANGAAVVAADVLAGVDSLGNEKGLAVLENVYPSLGVVPGTVIAPKFSANPEVALAMAAQARSINETFKAIALCDLDGGLTNYADLLAYKNQHSLSDDFLALCWPRVGLEGKSYWLSTHAAALMSLVDADNGQIPYESPSNKLLKVDSTSANGTDLSLSKPKANTLNGWGIITAMNFNGWRLWGSRMSCYPNDDDPKDAWLPVRRMFNWLTAILAINYFSRIDKPVRKRLVESVVDEVNLFLSGLQSQGVILGGKIAFLEDDNPTQDLIDGKIVFRIYYAPPTPARSIEFLVEFDVTAYQSLFS